MKMPVADLAKKLPKGFQLHKVLSEDENYNLVPSYIFTTNPRIIKVIQNRCPSWTSQYVYYDSGEVRGMWSKHVDPGFNVDRIETNHYVSPPFKISTEVELKEDFIEWLKNNGVAVA